MLWSGPAVWALARASEELRNHWLDHPRLTVTEHARQRVAARRAARDDNDLAAMPAESEETEVTETYEDVPEAELDAGGDGVTRRGSHGAMSYADIEAVEAEWLWDGRIPLGEVTVLAAMGGTGKTFAMCDLAARVTRGDALPGGTPPGPPGTVFIVNAEDDASTVLVHQLAAARADLSRVIDFSEPDGGAFVLGGKEDCVPMLHEAITAAGDVRLVILDPLAGISAVGLTAVHRVQVIMRSLRRVARDTGVAIVVIHHLTKAGTVVGSKAVVDAVRSVLVAEKTEDGSRVITWTRATTSRTRASRSATGSPAPAVTRRSSGWARRPAPSGPAGPRRAASSWSSPARTSRSWARR